jgi:hypothetical protein
MRKLVLVTVAALAALAGTSTALAARGGTHGKSGAHAKKAASTCTGTLASGRYQKLVVPAGETCDGTNAVINVRGGVRVGEGATFVLGVDHGPATGKIRGGVRAKAPKSLQLHSAHVSGGVRMRGGGGPKQPPAGEPPVFSTVEDNVIRGGATINGYSAFWLGFIRNTVRGTVKLSNNDMGDPDANEFVTNTIKGNLVCHHNSPPPQVGDSEGLPNVVTGRKVDQCAVPGL